MAVKGTNSYAGAPMADPDQDFDRAQVLPLLENAFNRAIPFSAALGITVVDCGVGMVAFRLPYQAELVGDPERGILHGGAITALLDGACGASVFMKMAQKSAIATLDLRIDYLRPATPGRDVIARAECYRLTRSIAFVRAFAFHDEGDPIAAAAASFMLATKGDPILEQSR